MMFLKRQDPDPDEVRFEALKQLRRVADELEKSYADNPEALDFLQEVQYWVARRMIDELE